MINNIINFISHNLMLSIIFVLVVLIYVSFELFNWLSGGKVENKISVVQLVMLFNHDNALIIDIRPEAAYNLGHIVDAISMSAVDCNSEHKIIKSNSSRPIIIVDEHGKDAAVCCSLLLKSGVKQVLYLHGGLESWRTDNMPLVISNIKNDVSAENIIIYTKDSCPYCLSAKNLLRSKGFSYREIKVAGVDTKEFIEMTRLSSGLQTMPQIFIKNRHIGGFDALKDLNDKGELDKMLKKV